MKKMIFFAGVVAGVAVAKNWRGLTKSGIKVGIRAGLKLKEFSQQAAEDIEDIAAEAIEELAEQERQQEQVGVP